MNFSETLTKLSELYAKPKIETLESGLAHSYEPDFCDMEDDYYDVAYTVWNSSLPKEEQDEHSVQICFTVGYDLKQAECEWSSYDATYVPYGETSVLLEPAGKELESVDVSSALPGADYQGLKNWSGKELTEDEAAQLLGCTIADLKKAIISTGRFAEGDAQSALEEYVKEHPDELPDDEYTEADYMLDYYGL